eukprot:COSAG01_NODE_1401_length_10450_cov_100.148198_15_plen_262_part_00
MVVAGSCPCAGACSLRSCGDHPIHSGAPAGGWQFMGAGSLLLLLVVAVATYLGEAQSCFRRCREVKLSRIGGYVLTLFYTMCVVAVPFVLKITWSLAHWRPHDVAWLGSGIATILCTTLSLNQIRKHLENYTAPRLQRHIVRILLMPPIYAIDCWICMRFNSLGKYLTVVREFYEGFCIWSFMLFMMDFLYNVARSRRVQERGNAYRTTTTTRPPSAFEDGMGQMRRTQRVWSAEELELLDGTPTRGTGAGGDHGIDHHQS